MLGFHSNKVLELSVKLMKAVWTYFDSIWCRFSFSSGMVISVSAVHSARTFNGLSQDIQMWH
jgi:hypothetical protein